MDSQPDFHREQDKNHISCLSQQAWTTTSKRTEQNRIYDICSSKSEAEATNTRRLSSTYCTIEANYWQTRSIARPLCDSKAACLRQLSQSSTQGTSIVKASNNTGVGKTVKKMQMFEQ